MTLGFYIIYFGFYYFGLYSGFVCWCYETLWWGIWTLNIVNIEENI